jgi:LacI family transcriptional regulator
MIAVVIPNIVHFFFSSVISGIEHVCNDAGYNVMICQSDESEDREKTSLQTLVSSRVDGILVSVSKNTNDFSPFREIIESVPLVCFDRTIKDINTDKVIIDDVKGAFIATEHLIKEGCKKIIHLAAPQNLLIGQRRKEGYIKALKQYGLPVDESLIIKCDNRDDAIDIMRNICKNKINPDGIFCVNDLTASGVLKVIKEFGRNVPDDIKVVGFSDGFVAGVTDPTLTTIDQHGFDMGKQAAQLLLDRINNVINNYSPVTKVIPVNLIKRESTGY